MTSEAYRSAGVDTEAADRLVGRIGPAVTATWGDRVLGGFGGFAAGVRIPEGYREPILMLSTDGVGTKLELARMLGRYDTVGHDLVAMCADDLAAVGAEPIGFVDYVAVGALDEEREATIVSGVAAGCELAGCALVGGETAEHPGVMEPDQVDLAGTALGVVEADRRLHPGLVEPGDVLIGVDSPNLRSNGFSLVRRILDRVGKASSIDGVPILEVLLEPSVIYSPAAIAAARLPGVHGLVHVTGGGLPGNVPRVLPEGLGAAIDTAAWRRPEVFGWLRDAGDLSEEDAYGAFNMGIGYVCVADPAGAEEAIVAFEDRDHPARVIGRVTEASGFALS